MIQMLKGSTPSVEFEPQLCENIIEIFAESVRGAEKVI